jgi:predicted porin
METTKPWSVSASLRGFYDDNYSAVSKTLLPRSSVGFELRPTAGLNLFPTEQSYLGLQYTYSMKYYDDRPSNKADHSHEFEAKASHAFSERYKMDFEDSFVYAQEPELINPANPAITGGKLRTDSNAVRNRASLNFKGQVNERMGVGMGYDSSFYDYEQDGAGSRSAELDRVEHLLHVDARWLARPGTIGLIGYQYGITDHTSKDPLYATNNPAFFGPQPLLNPPGSARDNTSHKGYVGVEHEFNPQLSVDANVGIQYTKYDKAIGGGSSVGPYADVSGTYTYRPGSSLQAGIRHSRNATDVTGSPADPTLDQETTTLYGSVSHQLQPNFFLNLLSSYQHSIFNGGGAAVDGRSEDYYSLGMNVEYRFNQNWSAEAGYNYDRLSSDTPNREFDRNRVYVGVRATY